LTFSKAGEELGLPLKTFSVEDDYIPIERITYFDVDTFYEKYKIEANNNECFDVSDPEWENK
jgi:hypothetical protein